jgi:hypothetical protein
MSRKSSGVARVRVQLDLAPLEVAALDGLRDSCNLRSRADAVRYALGIMEWVAREASNGSQVVSISKQSVLPLVVPGITHRGGAPVQAGSKEYSDG